MKNNPDYSSDLAFTPAVKALQARKGSRKAYARWKPRWLATAITPELAAFIAEQTSVFLGTATAKASPTSSIAGDPGFSEGLDDRTLAFADFRGNRQYITQGNLAENSKAHLFLIDYERGQRVKLWGEALIVEDDPALLAELMPPDYRARGEQALVFG